MGRFVFCGLLFVAWGWRDEARGQTTQNLGRIVPLVEFAETPFGDALAFLRRRSIELDPAGAGINFVVMTPELRTRAVTLRLREVPLGEALRYTTMLVGADFAITPYAVTIRELAKGQTSRPRRENTALLQRKLQETVAPSIEFSDTPLVDAIDFLSVRSEELGDSGQGINFVYLGDRGTSGEVPISLKLSRIPLGEVLRYTVQLGDHGFRLETYAVLVFPLEPFGAVQEAPGG